MVREASPHLRYRLAPTEPCPQTAHLVYRLAELHCHWPAHTRTRPDGGSLVVSLPSPVGTRAPLPGTRQLVFIGQLVIFWTIGHFSVLNFKLTDIRKLKQIYKFRNVLKINTAVPVGLKHYKLTLPIIYHLNLKDIS